MSVSQQKKFLTKLHRELSVDSEDYRRQTANKRMHTFVVTRRAIRRGIKDRLEKNYPDIPKSTILKILKESDVHVRKLIRQTGRNIVGMSNRDNGITVTKFTPSKIEAAFEASGKDRFSQIKRSYDKHWGEAAKGISGAVRKVLEVSDANLEAKSLWNLEHNYLKGIIETQVKDAINNALLEEEAISRASVQNFFKGMGIKLDVIRNGDTGVMEVFMGSQRANAKEGGIAGAKAAKLKRALLNALRTLENGGILSNLEGSDSFKTSKIKKARREVIEPFKKVKNATVVSKDSKAKNSKTKASKNIVQKTLVGKNASRKKSIRASKSKKAGAASQPLQLIGLINKQLPDTVRKNMQSPQLQNRTGRFAQSVQVTDIVQTPKGFPSIGYTYQKSPYGVFEDGAGAAPWANGERDPRDLIDKSIREIAAQFAIGRFYTRRV